MNGRAAFSWWLIYFTLQMLHSSASVMLSQSPHSRELQQQGCAMVPKEQFLQLQHQLLQAERRSQRLQEELESRPSETNMQQVKLSLLCRLPLWKDIWLVFLVFFNSDKIRSLFMPVQKLKLKFILSKICTKQTFFI